MILPPGDLGRYTAQSGTISSTGDLVLNTSGALTNSGYITAAGTTGILADSLDNVRPVSFTPSILGPLQKLEAGGVISGSDVVVRTQGDLINMGGTIAAVNWMPLV